MALSIGGFSNTNYYDSLNGYGNGRPIGTGSDNSEKLINGIPNGTDSDKDNPLESGRTEETTKKAGRRSSPAECETCKNRKYVDGSNENDVSFKTPTHISPQAAPGAVASHEGMHVQNAYSKAAKEGGKVLQASVSIHTAVCPECGRVYVSGGTTTTAIATSTNPYKSEENALNKILNDGKSLNAAV